MKRKVRKVLSFVLAVLMVLTMGDMGVQASPSRQADDPGTVETRDETKSITVSYDGKSVAYSYTVSLPQGYDAADTDRRYPVLYVMPEDGLSAIGDTLAGEMDELLDSTSITDVIVVKPSYISQADNEKAEVYQATKAIIDEVDQTYNTIASAGSRAVLGAKVGGYLATILTYTNGEGETVSTPALFGMMASINGDFVGEDNIWKDVYGDFWSIATDDGQGNGFFNNQIANRFYTFMDAASEDAAAYADHGANDIISYMINRGGAYGGFWYGYYGNADSYALKLTVKNGAYDDSFIKQSVDEALTGIGDKLMQNMITGSVSLTPQAAYATQEDIEAVYHVSVGSSYSDFCADQESPLKLTISMTDPDTGEKVAEDQTVTFDVKAAGDTDYNNENAVITLPNTIHDGSTTVTLSCEILGKEIELDSQSLVRIAATGSAPEEQLIDLLGGWKFYAFKGDGSDGKMTLEPGTLPEEDEYSQWETVQPCLGWWNSSLSSVTDMKSYAGYAWYIKEFDIPADFPEGEYYVPVGYFDETDICFINGVEIGCTGLNEETWAHETDCWDTERIYSISSDNLNIGGKNVMVVLTHNQSGDGGWYDGHPGLYSAAAYNKLTSKPSTYASETNKAAVEKTVADQIAAIRAKDISAYAATVDAQYFQSGTTKDTLLEEVSSYMKGDGEIQITDKNAYVFESGDLFYYQASRTLVDAAGTAHDIEVNEYYQIVNGAAVLYGEHDRFFAQQIPSEYRAKMLNSQEATVEENFMVYLPEGYFDPENANKRYPTAYVFHQLNSSSNSYAIDGIDQILDEGIADGSIKDTILIIPDSNNNGFWYNGWDKMVTEEILPYVDAHYRTIADARYRFTAGASMGGSGSYYIGLTNPNLFSGIISFFGAINMGGRPLEIAQEQSSEYLGYFTQYFICGNRDLYKFGIPAITLDKLLRGSGQEHFFELEEGEHDSSFYIPYVKSAFAYQTDAMTLYTDEQAAEVISGSDLSCSITDGAASVTAKVNISGKVSDYLAQIPASAYTTETNPALEIPVTVTVYKDGKAVCASTEIISAKEETTETLSWDIASMDLSAKESYDVKVTASLLNASAAVAETTVKEPASQTGNGTGQYIPVVTRPTVETPSVQPGDGTGSTVETPSDQPGDDSVPTVEAPSGQPDDAAGQQTPGTKADQTISLSRKKYSKTYGDKAFSLGAKASTKLTYVSSDKTVATVSAAGKVTIKGPGTATITITAAEDENYNAAEATVAITVKPKKTVISKVSSPKKGKLKVTWKKAAKVSGYEILYSTKSSFKNAKKVTISKDSTTSWTGSATKGKKYYVKIRSYKTLSNGKKLYGAYSSVKSVTIKKK